MLEAAVDMDEQLRERACHRGLHIFSESDAGTNALVIFALRDLSRQWARECAWGARGGGCRPAVRIVRGREKVLEAQPLLAELARRSGQAGEADNLAYILSSSDSLKKLPCLLMVGGAETGGLRGGPDWEGMEGAVLVFEYQTRLGGTRVFATADGTGRRTVIAAADSRARIAALAARTLIEGGAHIAHVTFSETHRGPQSESGQGSDIPKEGCAEAEVTAEFRRGGSLEGSEWLLAEREMPLYLPLYGTFDATLARIGQRTRSNLRYYRRRSELDLGCRFIAEVEIELDEFLAFNRECTYAVTDELAEWRYEMLHTMPKMMLRGVRGGDGRWLSLVGMRGNGEYVEIDWQMNRAELRTYSLSTVMRSYLIEHEIGRGTTRLYIEGGTPQPIGRSFLKERVGELTLKRRSLYVWLLERFAGRIFPVKNRLAQILMEPGASWRRTG